MGAGDQEGTAGTGVDLSAEAITIMIRCAVSSCSSRHDRPVRSFVKCLGLGCVMASSGRGCYVELKGRFNAEVAVGSDGAVLAAGTNIFVTSTVGVAACITGAVAVSSCYVDRASGNHYGA